MTPFRRGLYAITDSSLLAGRDPARAVAEAVSGGATVVQYRDKSSDQSRRVAEAAAIAEVCRRASVPFLVNDDVELALEVGADGVHLGRDDGSCAAAKGRLGTRAIVGISCYGDLARAQRAVQQGADYVAFGRFFPSGTKPGATPAHPALLSEAKALLPVPVVAIGGITADNGAYLVSAGADNLAVIGALFGANDIRAAAARLAGLYTA